MSKLTWDQVGHKNYETGVDQGVLYPCVSGVYQAGVAWNGLISVTESPSGAEANPIYADNQKYLNLISAEEFGASVEAYTYPDEFAQCDGSVEAATGVFVGQQKRVPFGLCYRTLLGNDTDGTELGYKIHVIYGAQATPSEKAYSTVNDSPEAITFSWDISTTPVAVAGLKPTACITIDSTKVPAEKMAELEAKLYGSESDEPTLLLPDEIIALVGKAS